MTSVNVLVKTSSCSAETEAAFQSVLALFPDAMRAHRIDIQAEDQVRIHGRHLECIEIPENVFPMPYLGTRKFENPEHLELRLPVLTLHNGIVDTSLHSIRSVHRYGEPVNCVQKFVLVPSQLPFGCVNRLTSEHSAYYNGYYDCLTLLRYPDPRSKLLLQRALTVGLHEPNGGLYIIGGRQAVADELINDGNFTVNNQQFTNETIDQVKLGGTADQFEKHQFYIEKMTGLHIPFIPPEISKEVAKDWMMLNPLGKQLFQD